MQSYFKAQSAELAHVLNQIFLCGVPNVQALGIRRETRRKFLDNSLLQLVVLARRKCEVFAIDFYRIIASAN